MWEKKSTNKIEKRELQTVNYQGRITQNMDRFGDSNANKL